MWQPRVEIEHHSVAYFHRITVFGAPQCRTSINGWGSYTVGKLMNTYHIYTARMSPALNGSFALQHLQHSNMIKIRNGIMLDFYLGLPHIITPSVSLENQTFSVPQHQLHLVLHTESVRHCEKKGVWLARLPQCEAKQISFLMPTLNSRVFAMISLQK